MMPSGESTTWLYRVSGVLLVGLIGVSVPPAAISETNGQETQARPNLLFIVTDDQGPWTLGAEGHRNAVTPELDKLAAQGALLKNAFAVAAVCSPARASLISGRYPTEAGIDDYIPYDSSLGMNEELATWPQVLGNAGYQTALVGKWHLGHAKEAFHPTRRGYARFAGWPVGGRRSKDPSLEVEGVWTSFPGQYTSDVLADLAMDYLREFRSGPFALSVHFWAPHANQGVPDGYKLPYPSRCPRTGTANRTWLPLCEDDLRPWRNRDLTVPNPSFPNLDITYVERMMREYYASVHSVDRNVGRILRRLDELELSDNTIVIFTSDHGYNMGHHGIWHKGNGWWATKDRRDPAGVYPDGNRPNMYDNSLRVPAIVRWPRRIRPGTVVAETVTFLDWFPTILAMTGVPKPEGLLLRGRNALPLLRGEQAKSWDNDLFAQYRKLRAYRTPDWKLVRDFGPHRRDELYHLTADPAECRNLIDSPDPTAQTARRELEARLHEAMRRIGDPQKETR